MIALFVILFLWSCIGFLYWIWDTASHIDSMERSEDPLPTWIIVACGPLVWLFIALSFCAIMLIYLFALFFGTSE